MSKFEENKFSKLISSIFKQNKKEDTVHSMIDDTTNVPSKEWHKEYEPLRKLVLWGLDDNNNPSFLILYGRQKFKKNVLSDNVTYDCYAVFKGKAGHFPSFEAVKIIEEYDKSYKSMYFKKGLKYDYYWEVDSEYEYKDFQNLDSDNQIAIPYFIQQEYNQYVQKIEQNIQIDGFKLVNNQNEILKLQGENGRFSKVIIDIISKDNIYMRKKRLHELLNMNPPKEIYIKLLEIGSTELISGLFLELAKMGDAILLEEAKNLIENEINFADENYANGVKRCANIYVNAIDANLKADRIKWIRKTLSDMDLHIRYMHGKDVSEDKVLAGAVYRKYAIKGKLRDYYFEYEYANGEYTKIKKECSKRYKSGAYTDGKKLKLIELKNTIQEAEIYGLADVIGKVAYYLDAPRLTYYFKGNSKTKALKYFHRYIKRIINSYAESDQDKFMESMKYLLTSYTNQDYVCKFDGNFQFNELIKYYLYYDFKEEAPKVVHWRDWSKRYAWISNDQLIKLEGRYEYKKEIWDNHLEVVAYIAISARLEDILKACYYILKDSPKSNEFIENITYKQLINLANVNYQPIAEMFMGILTEKLDKLNVFEPELMLVLMGSPNKEMQKKAMEFFDKTNGSFSGAIIADLILLDNLEDWTELFKQNLESLSGEEYVLFIMQLINETSKFLDNDKVIPGSIKELITLSTDKMESLSKDNKAQLVSGMLNTLLYGEKKQEWIGAFIEDIIFALPLEELENILSEITIESVKVVASSRNKRIISVLESIKNSKLMNDAQIVDILGKGTAKTVKILFSIISKSDEELSNRFSTILIMLESDIVVLNKKAEEVFDEMTSERQKKLHALIIDSPVERVYLFGLNRLNMIYGEVVPEEFIIQMLEHTSPIIKAYISDKTDKIIDNLGDENEKLFMYYLKTLLLLPNKVSKSKDKIYNVIPKFVSLHNDKLSEVEEILMDIGSSNIILDSERALVALAKIREEGVLLEG